LIIGERLDPITKRGMLTVIHMYKENGCAGGNNDKDKENACKGKDDEVKKNACDKCGKEDCDGTCDESVEEIEENACKTDEEKKNTNEAGQLFSATLGIKYNKDGTLPIDIFRTGVWRHPYYGTVNITEEYLDSVMKNFEEGVIGRKVTFDYHHEHRMNYGMPRKLRKEERQGTFVKKPFTMLVADVALTAQGKSDTESGQVLNFSSEVSDDYIHNEMMPVVCVDDRGEVVTDSEGNVVEKYIAKRYGPTLLGGAVTNHPFITELNPNGLGGNLESFKMSIDGGLMVADPHKLSKDNLANMCFSADIGIDRKDDQVTALADLKYEAAIDAAIFDELLNNGSSFVMAESCIYDANEYKAGDAALPDAAYAVIYEVKGRSGQMLKVRKLPHHNKGVTSPADNGSLDIPRLKNALARLNQTDAPAAEIKTASGHLNSHADATYRKPKKNSTTEENYRMADDHKPGTEIAPPVAPPADVKTFSMADVKTLVQSSVSEALSVQRAELEQKFAADNAVLRAHMEAEQSRAYSLEVDSFVGKIAGGKATPAFQKVARFGLLGNKNLTIRYFNDEKKEYENISLQAFVNKISETADFDNVGTGDRIVEVGNGGEKKHSAPKTDSKVFSAEDVKAMTNDPAKFAAFMKDHASSMAGFKSTAVSGANGTGKPQA